jgi:hypothetical protein
MSDAAAVRVERVIALTDRIADALDADLSALEKGRPRELHTLDPSIQQLTALYAREAGSINASVARSLSPELRNRLSASTKRMNDLLKRHQRIITRVRNASEGLIRAVAQEVERRRSFQRSYAPRPAARPQAPAAMLHNSVV